MEISSSELPCKEKQHRSDSLNCTVTSNTLSRQAYPQFLFFPARPNFLHPGLLYSITLATELYHLDIGHQSQSLYQFQFPDHNSHSIQPNLN